MKNSKLTQILMIGLALILVGCASEKKDTSSEVPFVEVPTGTYVPTGVGPGLGSANGAFGSTADLNVASLDILSDYTGRAMNNPTNIKVNVNFVKIGDNSYGGHVTISYTENGALKEGYFTTGASEQEARYNVVLNTSNGQRAFHAVLEDFRGGLVIVVDEFTDLGDGNGAEDIVGGSVYYKNFGLTYAPHPPTRCWFVGIGPYDCRPWPTTGTEMNTYQSLAPNAGYIKLGDFHNLSLSGSFNGELDL